MPHWKTLLKTSIIRPADLPLHLVRDQAGMARVTSVYPMRINPYYLSLIQEPGDPLWRQAMPDSRELTDRVCMADPLAEESLSPVPNLIHKYPDRALFLVHAQCAMYCRFCTRKRMVGTTRMRITADTIRAGLDYLKKTPAIRDVLVSGGDPLLLEDEALANLLQELRKIKTIEIIRIGTRVPCVLPMRVTKKLASLLKRFHPLYINTHFNHPAEINQTAATACARLADAGIPLGCQTVLLKGINDDPAIIRALMQKLLTIRVKPYYLFQGDMTRGTDHFRTPLRQGIDIMRSLIGHTSGLAVPTLAVDLPGGGGKIPLLPEYAKYCSGKIRATNFCGHDFTYVDPAE